jgi:hypothetical protein
MTKQETTATVFQRAEVLAETLTAKLHQRWSHTVGKEYFALGKQNNFQQRFIRLLHQTEHGASVHAFIEIATGKIVKPAGWKAPAKYANGELASKYNLLETESFEKALEKCDEHGGWLYAR